jgi:hypothetical protein
MVEQLVEFPRKDVVGFLHLCTDRVHVFYDHYCLVSFARAGLRLCGQACTAIARQYLWTGSGGLEHSPLGVSAPSQDFSFWSQQCASSAPSQ